MITNPKLLQQAEDDFIRNNKLTIEQKYDIVESLYKQYLETALVKPEDPLEHRKTLLETVRKIHSASHINIDNKD